MRWFAFGTAVVATFLARPAWAQPIVCDEAVVHAEARRAREWRYGWTIVNTALAVGSFAAAPLDERESRPDWIICGAGSAITAAATWFLPLDVEAASDELHRLPAAQRARRLPRLMALSAADARSRVTWPWHVANFGLAALAGGIIAFGYDHHVSGLLTTVSGTALGEVQLWTQPTGLPSSCRSAAWTVVPRVMTLEGPGQSVTGGILSLSGAF